MNEAIHKLTLSSEYHCSKFTIEEDDKYIITEYIIFESQYILISNFSGNWRFFWKIVVFYCCNYLSRKCCEHNQYTNELLKGEKGSKDNEVQKETENWLEVI